MTRFIAVISGKGGVGKTTSIINLGYALHKAGRRVLLLDANLHTPNLASHLGFLNPPATLHNFIRREKELHEITYIHHSGISFIPASTTYDELHKIQPEQLVEVFEHLDDTMDYVLVDMSPGLGYDVSQVLQHTDETILICNPNLSSVLDTLKSIELARDNDNIIPGVILTMTERGKHELKVEEIENILHCPIIGNIKRDKKIKKSLHQGMPTSYLYPRSKTSKEYAKIAKTLSTYIL